jgi:LysM repeat protein
MDEMKSKKSKVKRQKVKFLSIFTFAFLLFALSGCVTAPYQQGMIQAPGIYHIVGSGQTLYRISKSYGVDIKEIMRLNNIKDPNQIGVGDTLLIPGVRAQREVEPYRTAISEPVEQIVGRKQYKVKWNYITLHHSATAEGNAEAFDRNHRLRNMGGLYYHFVIGNGTGSGDGEIEVGWRWRRQAQVERRREIEICLVGDFNRQEVSQAQYSSLLSLLKVLIKQYSIPLYHVRRNKDIDGKITECPGKNFPFYRVLADLRKERLK